jgi:glycosyltransferase involved in cell wall biosynthesis
MTKDGCRISIVMPCYNHGEFVAGSVERVVASKRTDLELIVVDDGSTDERTRNEMDALSARGVHVIRQKNAGVGAARNAGIRASHGEFIFPLDADDLLRTDWIDRALQIMDANTQVGVVYGDCELFGAVNQRWVPGPIDIDQLLERNYIPVSALIRRTVWDQNGGYDGTMPVQGYEDWDFWVGAVECGWEFEYLPEIFFDYRKANVSMLTRAAGFEAQVEEFVAKKHGGLYRRAWLDQLKKTRSVKWTSRQLGTLLSARAMGRWEGLSGRRSKP